MAARRCCRVSNVAAWQPWRRQDQVFLYSALLGDYHQQFRMGNVLLRETDPTLVEAGKAMQACSQAAMPHRR